MFDRIVIDQSSQWEEFSFGELVENLVFFESVEITTNKSRLRSLLLSAALRSRDYITTISDAVNSGRLKIFIDDFPIGEIFLETGLLWSTVQEALTDGGERINREKHLENAIQRQSAININQYKSSSASHLIEDFRFHNLHNLNIEKQIEFILDKSIVINTDHVSLANIQRAQNFLSILNDDTETARRLVDILLRINAPSNLIKHRVFKSYVLDQRGFFIDGLPGPFLDAISKLNYIYEFIKENNTEFDAYLFEEVHLAVALMFKSSLEKIPTVYSEMEDARTLQRVVTGNYSISEAFELKRIDQTSIEKLLIASDRLRPYVANKPKEVDLAGWYINELGKPLLGASDTKKTARWAMFTVPGLALDLAGAGGIGTAIGLGLGALDALLLDRLSESSRAKSAFGTALRQIGKS